jgi:hypothetical protein
MATPPPLPASDDATELKESLRASGDDETGELSGECVGRRMTPLPELRSSPGVTSCDAGALVRVIAPCEATTHTRTRALAFFRS